MVDTNEQKLEPSQLYLEPNIVTSNKPTGLKSLLSSKSSTPPSGPSISKKGGKHFGKTLLAIPEQG